MTPSAKITAVLQGVRELADKATFGPWKHDVALLYGEPSRLIHNGTNSVVQTTLPDGEADADFIAASRDMMPRLVAALEHEMETSTALMRGAGRIQGRKKFVEKRRAEFAAILVEGGAKS